MSMNLSISSLQKIDSPYQIKKSDLGVHVHKIPDFLERIKERKQGFLNIWEDETTLRDIEFFAENTKGKYHHLVLLGIGGSALGAKAIRDAFPHSDVSLHILDNIDPDSITDVISKLDTSKTLFLVISKSGNTIETLTQYKYFSSQFPDEDFVCVTGKTGQLRSIAQEKNIPIFDIPQNIGGRFSVLSAVGLLPAALLGIDIRTLISGAQAMRELFESRDFLQNTPFKLALIQYLLIQKGISQHVFMPYGSRLRSFTEWLIQLIAESTGKNEIGITPIAAQGTTDQHSLLQLLTEGPNDKCIFFLEIEKFHGEEIFSKLLHTELRATADSLTEINRPHLKLSIRELSPEVLGQLFFLFEGSTAFLGEFLGIDVYNQPGVERSKTLIARYSQDFLET
jgi:glucose-6-phosphate isomerase